MTELKPYENHIYSYYQAIKDGSIVVSKEIAQVYGDIVKALETGELVYDAEKANKAIDYIESKRGYPLHRWQKALVATTIGLVNPKTGSSVCYKRAKEEEAENDRER